MTVIVDLTPLPDGSGSAILLDVLPGRSKQVVETWLSAQNAAWRKQVEVVAMDGFTGYKTAATTHLPAAIPVMDPFHVVRLAGDALTACRQRIQQEVHGRRGKKTDPLYRARRTLLTGQDCLTDRQQQRLDTLFTCQEYQPVYNTWKAYQRIVAAYRARTPAMGREMIEALMQELKHGVAHELIELKRLTKTLQRRLTDILAYFDRSGLSNGPTEAINGRPEHLRGIGLGFRNFTNYWLRCLLHTGGFRNTIQTHPPQTHTP